MSLDIARRVLRIEADAVNALSQRLDGSFFGIEQPQRIDLEPPPVHLA